MKGFIGAVTGRAGSHMFTVAAWETPDDPRQLRGGAHRTRWTLSLTPISPKAASPASGRLIASIISLSDAASAVKCRRRRAQVRSAVPATFFPTRCLTGKRSRTPRTTEKAIYKRCPLPPSKLS